MPRSRLLLIGGALLLAAGLAIWFRGDAESGARREVDEPSGVAPSHAADTAAPPRPEDRMPVAAAVQILELDVRDASGAPARCELAYRVSPQAPRTSDMLLRGETGSSSAELHTRSSTGTERIELQPGSWLALRVTQREGAGLTAFRLFPPFTGTTHHRLNFAPDRRTVTAWLLQSDMAAPLANAEVRLFETKLDSAPMPAELQRGRTDEHGICRFENLPPSGYFVCAPDAQPGDSPPHVHRLIHAEQQPVLDVWCTLVAPEPQHEVALEVEVEPGTALDHGSRLFLYREEPPDGRLFPLPGPIAAGTFSTRLPAGAYRLGSLPLTDFATLPELVRVEVPNPGTTPRVRLRRPRDRVTVRVTGSVDRPLNVQARIVGVPLAGTAELLYLGPHQWVSDTIEVGSSQQPLVITAASRRGVWIAHADVRLVPPEQTIELSPATRLELQWCGNDAMRAHDVSYEVTHGGRTELVIPSRTLLRSHGPEEPAWRASLIVARGPVRVVARAADVAEPAWVQEVECQAATALVRFSAPRRE